MLTRLLSLAVLAAVAFAAPSEARIHHAVAATAAPAKVLSSEHLQEALVARNYSRPTYAQLSELGFPEALQLGSGTYGVDVSQATSEDAIKCMKSKGYSFLIARGFQETCNVDPNARATVEHAWAAGFAHVDLYLFPSYGCSKSAATQMDELINSMGNTKFGSIWLDVETGGQKSADFNHAWVAEALAQGAKRLGKARMGVYASAYEWGQVMGSHAGFTEYPLWYPDYDGSPSFAGFRSFAGWTKPNMKQFSGSQSFCGAGVDLNWY